MKKNLIDLKISLRKKKPKVVTFSIKKKNRHIRTTWNRKGKREKKIYVGIHLAKIFRFDCK
jgi:hypothetical protein